ncbi:MAG: hypothetical protein II920_11225 [Clostridia bacterium]|nr:hypothetical protein [Clostridia bacterium]
MYCDNDVKTTAVKTRTRVALGIILICAFVALIITFTALKLQAPVLIASGVGFIVCYFVWSFKIMPWIHYNRFIKELTIGRKRVMECEFEDISSETRMFDNIEVRDVTVSVGKEEEDERLYVLDADKQFPDIAPGERITVTSYGNFITDIAKA